MKRQRKYDKVSIISALLLIMMFALYGRPAREGGISDIPAVSADTQPISVPALPQTDEVSLPEETGVSVPEENDGAESRATDGAAPYEIIPVELPGFGYPVKLLAVDDDALYQTIITTMAQALGQVQTEYLSYDGVHSPKD